VGALHCYIETTRMIQKRTLIRNVVLAGRSVQTGLYLTAGSTARSLVRSITSLRPHRWIGDPCGTIRHNGCYLAYSWGAAQSDDLLHWTEINDHAIKGLPKGTAAFTGSVVADRENSAGYSHTYVFHVYVSRSSF